MPKTVLVCQHITCSQQGSADVLKAFQLQAPSDFKVEPSSCLGQCGSGPMVLILPEQTWYCNLYPSDVSLIVEQHLKGGKIVKAKLYPKFHPAKKSVGIWLIAFVVSLGLLLLFFWILASQSYYF